MCVFICIIYVYVILKVGEIRIVVGKIKVFGMLMGIGGVMLLIFYKGFFIDFLKFDINFF